MKKWSLALIWVCLAACKSANIANVQTFSDHYGKEIGRGQFVDADTIEVTGFAHHSGKYGATMAQISREAAGNAEQAMRNVCLPEGPERVLPANQSTRECYDLGVQLRLQNSETPTCATDGQKIDCNIVIRRQQSGLRDFCGRCNRLRLYGEKRIRE